MSHASKPHSMEADFDVMRTHGFCENMADRPNFGDRQCWEKKWHRRNWCASCDERMDALSRIEEQLEAKRRALVLAETNLGYADERMNELKEQLDAMRAVLVELLSWHPQLPQVREKVMHPQHQEAVERAEALVASNPAKGSG